MPKFLYVVLVVLVVLVLAIGGSSLYLKKSGAKLSNLKITKRTLSWLNKQRDERGTYTVGLKCDFNSNCEAPLPTNRSGFSVLWAENRYLQKNNDEKEMEIYVKENRNTQYHLHRVAESIKFIFCR